MTPIELYEWVNTVGLPGGLAVFLWALYKRILVWGRDCDKAEEKLEQQCKKDVSRLETALAIAQRTVDTLTAQAMSKLERLERWVEERSRHE